ncbi:DMT family transporter [Maridesulfovibrio ferrireducens]|uniref:DMT family transporter n=1 Tax=Maridesulfovibrio ferrireducens TaxID=246191 RepID=UPI001A2DD914|nr:DMT family transporter [Maridesulfovibrio ferrireducens]MBI9111004.1 DMT family transporter [Maridesulfovibrio ferrireducens]
MSVSDSKYLPVVALVIAVFLWASSFVVLKIALAVYDPMIVIFGRMILASLCFVFFIPTFRKQKFQKGDLKWLLVMAFCEPCMYFVFESHAMIYTSASQAGMIVATLPLLMAVSARFILGEKLSRKTLIGFVMAVIGGIWLSIYGSSTEASPDPMLGNFLEFLAMCCAVGYMTILKKMTAHYSALFITAFQAFMGAIFYLPLLALPTTVMPTTFHPAAAFSIIYLGIGITLGAYGLYNYGMSRLPANQTTAYVNLIPVFTLIMGWTILDEKLNTMQFIAAGLVMCGVILSQDNRSRKKSELI